MIHLVIIIQETIKISFKQASYMTSRLFISMGHFNMHIFILEHSVILAHQSCTEPQCLKIIIKRIYITFNQMIKSNCLNSKFAGILNFN